MLDIISKLKVERQGSGAPADTTAVATGVFAAGPSGTGILVATQTLADADATFDVLIQHGDDSGGSDLATVAVADLITGVASDHPSANPIVSAFLFSDDNKVFKFGYIGAKTYLKVTVTPAANTGATNIAILSVKVGRKGPYLNA